MTEETWFTVVAPESMLSWVAPRCSDRKLRLFAVACCRRVAHLCREKFARTLQSAEELAEPPPGRAPNPHLAAEWMTPTESTLAYALSYEPAVQAATESSLAACTLLRGTGGGWQERWYHAAFLCDIVGNPFRPAPAFAAEWRTSTVEALAREMYSSRDFSAMPILADALQEAGCENEPILAHCRDANGVHVRGCWVVDLVLGKS